MTSNLSRIAVVLGLFVTAVAAGSDAPHPRSPVITGVKFDWSTHQRLAPGSDNWPLTWADDDHQYTAFGDGGGFGGTNSKGRVSLGVARIEGDWNNYQGHNVWGGVDAEAPATFPGKSYGLICVDGVLTMWNSSPIPVDGSLPKPFQECRLTESRDHGKTWKAADWTFTREDGVMVPTICQFGRDYAGARDEYVYHYLIRFRSDTGPDTAPDRNACLVVQRPGAIDLARVPKHRQLDRSAWSFFAGRDAQGRPTWTTDLAGRQAVFEDREGGVGWNVGVSYNAGLKRYFLCTEHGESHRGILGIFDAPEPWGPWTTVLYENDWGKDHIPLNTFCWFLPTKWMSPDGRSFTMVFSGRKENDSWNTLRGQFVTDR
jgi:hypothetical protein